jgi:hypothetical protein
MGIEGYVRKRHSWTSIVVPMNLNYILRRSAGEARDFSCSNFFFCPRAVNFLQGGGAWPVRIAPPSAPHLASERRYAGADA